jgi:hypothetical protein
VDDQGCLSAIDAAARALQATRDLLVDRSADYTDPVLEAMAALEAARTARVYAAKVIGCLTDRALQLGASFEALGFNFTDPYD